MENKKLNLSSDKRNRIFPFMLQGIMVFFVFTIILYFSSCKNDNHNTDNSNDTSTVALNNSSVNISKPQSMAMFTLGEKIEIEAALPEGKKPDSVVYLLNGKIQKQSGNTLTNILPTDSAHVGNNSIVINAWTGGKEYSGGVSVQLKSNVIPQKYSYKIIKRYPHDPNAYTQGLIYENGFMYEGTGQYNESTLRKYKLSNGELIQSYNLPEDVFGEGIVISNNHIYQLTWTSKVAYEFEKESFKLINKFDFNTQGWGITNLDGNLVMSDGSYTMYVLSPESFNEIRRIEVYDNIGPVNQLNELELIDGKIYANVYQTDFIVIIDPKTGCVTGKIDLTGLLDQTKIKDHEVDVLNGIAWDAKGKRLFLTGKWWPEIYEVELVKK